MNWRADVPGASAGPSYVQTEAYRTGREFGEIDREEGWAYEPFQGTAQAIVDSYSEEYVRCYVAGYQDGYAAPDTECRCTGDDGCTEHPGDDPVTGDTRDEQHHERSQHLHAEEVEPL